MLKYVKMLVLRNQEIDIGNQSAVGVLIVIGVILHQPPFERNILQNDIVQRKQEFDHIFGYRRSGFLSKLFLVLK